MTRSHTYGSIACFVLVASLCCSYKVKSQGFNDSIIDAKLAAFRQHIVADLKTKGSWHINISGIGYESALTVTSSKFGWLGFDKFIPWYMYSDDQLHPGFGGYVTVIHEINKEKKPSENWYVESGMGYNYSQGVFIIGPPTTPGTEYSIIGRYIDQSLNFPIKLGKNFAARNAPMYFAVGVEYFSQPLFLNKQTPEGWRNFRMGRVPIFNSEWTKTINQNFLVEFGARIDRFERIESIGVYYKHNRKSYKYNLDKRFIGIGIKMKIV